MCFCVSCLTYTDCMLKFQSNSYQKRIYYTIKITKYALIYKYIYTNINSATDLCVHQCGGNVGDDDEVKT